MISQNGSGRGLCSTNMELNLPPCRKLFLFVSIWKKHFVFPVFFRVKELDLQSRDESEIVDSGSRKYLLRSSSSGGRSEVPKMTKSGPLGWKKIFKSTF